MLDLDEPREGSHGMCQHLHENVRSGERGRHQYDFFHGWNPRKSANPYTSASLDHIRDCQKPRLSETTTIDKDCQL